MVPSELTSATVPMVGVMETPWWLRVRQEMAMNWWLLIPIGLVVVGPFYVLWNCLLLEILQRRKEAKSRTL